MKLIYVGNLPPFTGGGALMGVQLLEGLAARGFGVRALAPITPDAESGWSAPGVDVARFPVPHFDIDTDVAATLDYTRLEGDAIRSALPAMIEEDRPDLLVAARETFAWHVPDVARTHGLPCMAILQGTTTAGMVKGTYARADELVEEYRRMDRVVVPAHHMARILEPYGLTNVKVIPNTIDVDAFRPRPRSETLRRRLGLPADAVVVAHASNLKQVKRPLHIVASAELALAAHDGLHYVVMGDGGGRREMEAACAERGIGERIVFAGWVDYGEVPEYLSVADIVVMTSEFEAQSLAKLEALACGRVLVSSDIDGARELIDDGRTGLLYRSGDVEDLAAKILLAAGDAELRTTIGRNAREAAMAHAREAGIAAYAETIEEVVRRA